MRYAAQLPMISPPSLFHCHVVTLSLYTHDLMSVAVYSSHPSRVRIPIAQGLDWRNAYSKQERQLRMGAGVGVRMCVCVQESQRPSPAPPPPPADANRASGARLHNPLASSAGDTRAAQRPSCDEHRRANTYRHFFFEKHMRLWRALSGF